MNFLTKIFEVREEESLQKQDSNITDSCSSFNSERSSSKSDQNDSKPASRDSTPPPQRDCSPPPQLRKLFSAENLQPTPRPPSLSLPPKFHRCLTLSSIQKTSHSRTPRVTYDSFEKLKVLGVGSFGKVILVRKKSCDSIFAMKVVKKKSLTTRMNTRIKMERNVMALHRHPFIVKLHYAFQQKGKLFFVMDYCEGGDLYYHLHPSRSNRRNVCGMAKFVTAQLTMALGHLHENGVIYRDLKPENVLFDSKGYIKLADFGLTKGGVFNALSGARSICGSLHYMAPEVLLLNERGPRAEYGNCSDWWGLGILLYEMFWGLPPWYTDDHDELVRLVKTARLQIPPQLNTQTKDFLKKILCKDPSKRLGYRGCEEVQKHEYFNRVEFDRLLRKEYAPTYVPAEGDSPQAANNFDDTFTRMPVESATTDTPDASKAQNKFFDNFDFMIDDDVIEEEYEVAPGN